MCGVILQESSAEKTNTFKEPTALVMVRLSGFQWQLKTRGLTRHLSQEGKELQDAKHQFRKALMNFEGCAERWNKDADYRECMQEHNRTYEPVMSWDKVAIGPLNTHNITPQQRQAHWGSGGMLFKLQLEDPNDTNASTSPRKHSDQDFVVLLRTRSRILRSEGGAQNNTIYLKTSHVFSCTTHLSCFQNLLLRCHFLSIVVRT